ncbi:MAG: EscU/YscU/HrcU family type III secretion system export apparatus switch protein [Steroidobacter sp.]
MAEQQSDLDRNEPATPHKLEKARKRGSIPRSAEVTFAVVLLACVACVYAFGMNLAESVALLFRRSLPLLGRSEMSESAALVYFGELGSYALVTIAPVVFVIWITALFVAGLQARGVFSAHPLKPDFSRINPGEGLKRIFSSKSLHELWRSCAKLAVIGGAMTLWGLQHLPDLLRLPSRPPAMALSGMDLLGSALSLLAGIVSAFALLDWLLTRWEYMRKMRMSKRDLKDEHKEREGDPRIKSRLRELRLAWFKRVRQMAKVRSADVLLTNPTHYAIALEYRHGEMPAPMITARGAGDLAAQMRKEARRRGVPIVEHAPLARALFKLRETQVYVPEEHFDSVARVLRWVYAARSRRSMQQVPE